MTQTPTPYDHLALSAEERELLKDGEAALMDRLVEEYLWDDDDRRFRMALEVMAKIESNGQAKNVRGLSVYTNPTQLNR